MCSLKHCTLVTTGHFGLATRFSGLGSSRQAQSKNWLLREVRGNLMFSLYQGTELIFSTFCGLLTGVSTL